MRVIEEIIRDENIRVVERETPDNFTPTDSQTNENPALARFEKVSVDKGQEYYVIFNTQREIRIETPKVINVLLWKITLISLTRINVDQLKVIYKVE